MTNGRLVLSSAKCLLPCVVFLVTPLRIIGLDSLSLLILMDHSLHPDFPPVPRGFVSKGDGSGGGGGGGGEREAGIAVGAAAAGGGGVIAVVVMVWR